MVSNDFFYQFGKDTFGPVMIGYTNWLISQTKDYDLILFLIRGGWIMWRLYEEMKSAGAPEGKLFYVSRRIYDDPYFPKYCKEVVGDAQRIAFCDTGWWGSCQNRVHQRAVPLKHCHGFLWGSRISSKEGKSGFVFERYRENDDIYLWEGVLNMLCPEPSVARLVHDRGAFSIVSDPYVFNRPDAEAFRAGVLAAVGGPSLTGPEAWQVVRRIHYEPTADELEHLAAIPHDCRTNSAEGGTIGTIWQAGKKRKKST